MSTFSSIKGYNKRQNISSTRLEPSVSPIKNNVPLANVGEVVPYVIGRRRVSKPNIISYGQPRALLEKTTVEYEREYAQPHEARGQDYVWEKVVETTYTPIGFLVDVMIGICLGPGVVLRAIYADNEPIWTGTAGPNRTVINIGENDTAFSGIQAAFNGGDFNQPVDPWTTPPVIEPSSPGNITVGLGTQDAGGGWSINYLGYIGPDFKWSGGQKPTVPATFGSLPTMVNNWEVVSIFDAYPFGGSGDMRAGSQIGVKGNRHEPALVITINDNDPVIATRQAFDPISNATFYRLPLDGTPQERFGFGGQEGNTFSLSISPEGPGSAQNLPAYVGIAYIYLRDMRIDMPLGNLSFEVERFPNPLALTNAQNRKNNDINIATAFYDVLTSDWGGAGIPQEYIGNSFREAALVFAGDESYCSIILDKETNTRDVIKELQSLSYSLVYPDPSTGKIEIKPIRQQAINLANIVLLGTGNVIKINDYNKTGWNDTLEVAQAVFPNRDNDYEPTPVVVKSNYNSTQSSARSAMISYLFAPRVEIVQAALSRFFSQSLVPMFEANILTDRSTSDIKPGDIAILNWPDYDIWSEPVIVSRIRKHPLTENTVSITVAQYRTPGMDSIYMSLPDEPVPTDLGTSPVAPTDVMILTAPFYAARAAGRIDVSSDTSQVYPMFFAVPANDIQLGATVTVENAATPNDAPRTIIGDLRYSVYGKLRNPINRFDGWVTGELGTLYLDGVINYNDIPSMSGAIRDGRYLLYIGDEIFAFETATQLPGQGLELTGVRRALVDTVARNHAADTHAFIANNSYGNIPATGFNVPIGYTPTWRLTSATINETGRSPGPATLTRVGWSPVARRSFAPPRPHDTKIDGIRRVEPITLAIGRDYTVTWKSRSRPTVGIKLQTDSADTNEYYGIAYQSHRVYLRDSNTTLRMIGETDNDTDDINSLVVTIPSSASLGAGTLFVRSYIDKGESVHDDEIPVYVYHGSQLTLNYEIEE